MKTFMLKSLYVIFPVISFCVAYLATAFYYLSLNPGIWSNEARLVTIIVGFGCMPIAYIMANIIDRANSK